MTAHFVPMYDAVTVGNLPPGATKYAGYVNGSFANHAAIVKRFPSARVFGIDVLGTAWEEASIFDWEKFDIQSGTVLHRAVVNRNKFRPHTACVYTDRANLDNVETILKNTWHLLWIATLDGTDLTGQHTATGSLIVATQVRGGIHAPFDTSNTLATWT
jgi:hypothetical protein